MTASNTKDQKFEQSEILQKKNKPSEDNSTLKELLAVIICAIFATAIMMQLDAVENLLKFSRSLEPYEFDEIAVFLPSFLAIGFVLFSYHRIQKLEAEMVKRREVERRLLKSEKMYKDLSITDDLTRLFNSRYFYKNLDKEIGRLVRYKQTLSLLLIDIDDFKKINDRYGHLKGDEVLKTTGRIIQDCLRKPDTAYRYGGEEFTVLLPETGIEAAMNVAERIRKRFEAQDFALIKNETLNISVSIGASQFNPGEEMEAFVKRVDDALYVAKQKGKNRVYSS